ncbi:hypothetical protein TRFO_05060 [Tritrichomonas foetus]|uniref:Dymeclin n=1 Tax=Tritrichomonas foetus TaxID=1144522 RepID=A0A1J4KEY4_9EUKA|nr:hypothetical protein TRFO_05060 [Tritrichomonas foetus]|eukprot:OHT07941.1 hypothetical protein TRFO_05060 [Tritrichomonas foetus]
MGHALSATGKLPEILDVLEHEDCGQIHQVWQQFTIRDFIKIEDEEKIEASLLRIKKDRPNNFSKFVSCIADVFEDSYNYSTSNPKTIFYFPPSCQFLCLLLSISGDEPKNSAWFQSPPNILNAKNPSPIFSIIQTFSKLLNFGRPANEIIQDLYSVNDLIEYTRVLLFILHSPSFHQKTYCMLDPTPYLLAFDSFPAKVYLPTLFKLIFLIFTQKNINQKLIFFIRTQLSLALPCLYSCKSWKDVLISLDPTLIHKALSVILLISKPTLNCAEQLVALLYVVLTNHKKYIDFLDNHNFTNNYIIGILLIYQYKTEIKSPITFLHSIMLLTLCRLTTTIPSLMRLNEPLDFSPSFNFVLSFNFSSSFNFVSFKKPQEGTVADMLIDIIYYSVLENFGSIGPILPLISGIISNIQQL